MEYSKNAVSTKVRAMYGKRLTKEDYKNLLNCKSVWDATNYLKNNTYYSQSLKNATPDINSAQAEELLELNLLRNFAKICRYEISVGHDFYKYFIIENDIKQILLWLELFISNDGRDYLDVLPAFFNSHTNLDLYKMANAKTYDELLKSLKQEDYYRILKGFENTYYLPKGYLSIEIAFNRYLSKFLNDTIQKIKKKKTNPQLEEIIKYKNDTSNIIAIYRAKKLFENDKNDIMNLIDTSFSNFTKSQIENLIDADDFISFCNIIKESYYKKDLNNIQESNMFIEGLAKKILYNKLKKGIRYYTDATAVMICYILLVRIEVDNLTAIIEGIRHNINCDIITNVLIV